MHSSVFCQIILGSDKMMVSVASGHNEYWPIYLSISNIHNNIWQAFLLFPKVSTIFHYVTTYCTEYVNYWIQQLTNFVMMLLSANFTTNYYILCLQRYSRCLNLVWRYQKLHASWMAISERYGLGPYIADYPEQALLACIVQGWCAKYVSLWGFSMPYWHACLDALCLQTTLIPVNAFIVLRHIPSCWLRSLSWVYYGTNMDWLVMSLLVSIPTCSHRYYPPSLYSLLCFVLPSHSPTIFLGLTFMSFSHWTFCIN